MAEITQLIQGFCTREVITVLALLATLLIGWKAAKYGWKATSKTAIGAFSLAKNVGFVGVAASLFMLAGLGSAGLGIGQLADRGSSNDVKVGFNNDELMTMIKHNADLETIIQYAKERDRMLTGISGDLAVPSSFQGTPAMALAAMVTADQPQQKTPLGQIWMTIGIGFALTIMSLVTYVANKEVKTS